MTLRIVTAAEQQLREHPSFQGIHDAWPEFLLHDRVVNEHWDELYTRAPELQLYLYDEAADRVLAEANTVPVVWDGTAEREGVDWAIRQVRGDGRPTTLCALQVMIRRDAQGHGHSRLLLENMSLLAREHGLDCLIAPVRPTFKERYPLLSMERYLARRRDDGLLLDPWLRTHERLGAELVGVAPESMRVEAEKARWEEWTGLDFRDGGDYVIPGALVPVRFTGTHGIYVEPNVWMRHPLPR